jgi:disulfide oxidoreductase YuzD
MNSQLILKLEELKRTQKDKEESRSQFQQKQEEAEQLKQEIIILKQLVENGKERIKQLTEEVNEQKV